MAIDLEFKGIGTELLATLEEAADRTARLRAEVNATAEAQTKGVATAVNAQQKYVQGLDAVLSAVTKIGSQQSGVNKLSQDTDKATTSAKGLTVALTEAERTAFAGLIEQAKELLATQHGINAAVSEEDQAVAALLVKMGALSQEEADLVVQAQAVTRAFADQGVSVDGVTQEIAKQGEGLRSNVGLLTQAQARIDEARNKLGTASSVEEIGKINDQIAEATAAYNVLATASERASNAADQGLTEQVGLLAQLESRIDLLNQKLDSAQTPEAIAIINDELAAASEEYERIATASQRSAQVQSQALAQPLGILDQLRARIALLEQKKATLVDPKAVAQVNVQIKEVQKRLQEIDSSGGNGGIESLRTQFMAAKNEAAAMVQEFGRFSPEAQAALQKAANLKDEISDLSATLDALNPDAKFQAFGQTLTALAGGFQAVQGAAGLLGAENEDVQKGLLKIQQIAAVTQGLQTFFGNFSDGLKNIRAVLGLTTIAQVANTEAQVAGTVAVATDTTAKGVNAVATTGVATATTAATATTGGFTAALRALAVVAAANPIGAIVVALAAIGGLFLAMGEDAEDSTTRVDALLKRLKFFDEEGKRARGFSNELQDIQNELDGLGTDDSPARQREQALRVQQRQVETLNADLIRARENQAKLLDDLSKIDPASETAKENQDKLFAQLDEQVNIIANEGAERVLIEERTNLELAKIDANANKERLDRAQKNADDRRRIIEELAAGLAAAEKAIADKVKEQDFEQATPSQKLAIQRKDADDEITILEQTILRKKALIEVEKELGATAFKELSEPQKQAKADALISAGDVQLDASQLEQLMSLRLGIIDRFLEDSLKLEQANDREKLELITDRNEREQKELEANLVERAEKLRLAGSSEAEIEADAQRQRSELGKGQAQRSRDVEEEIAIARVEAIKEGGDLSAEEQRQAELKILAIKLAARQADLAALGDAQDEETRKRRQGLETMIASLQGAVKTLAKDQQPIDLFDLLGIDLTDKEKQRVNEAVGNVIGLVEASIAAQRAEVDAQISATDELIADRERRSDSLRDQLDQEIELAKLGLANNVDGVRQQIAENDKAAVAEKQRKTKLVEDNKRLARQQLAIDAAQQVSSLITTGAEVFKFAASTGGAIGVIAAIGFIASVFAAFSSIKARAAAISNSGGASLKDGGQVEGPAHGTRYGDAGIALLNRRTGKEIGEMEGKEFIVNKRTTEQHRSIVEAINDNDLTTVARLALKELNRSERIEIYGSERTDYASQAVRELMETSNVSLSRERVREAVELKHIHESRSTVIHKQDNDRLLMEVKGLRKEVQGFKRQEGDRSKFATTVMPNGDRVERAPGVTTVVRKVKQLTPKSRG